MKKIILICLLFTSLSSYPKEGIEFEIGFAIANGFFVHESEELEGANLFSILIPDLFVNLYPAPVHAINIGIDFHLSLTEGRVGLLGTRIGYHWYFWGQGCPKTNNSTLMTSKKRNRFSSFTGSELKMYTYYLDPGFAVTNNFDTSGNFFDINALIGIDYVLTQKIKTTATLSQTILSLAATDKRIKMSGTIVSVGLTSLF